MGAIAGIRYLKGFKEAERKDIVRKMLESMGHRGRCLRLCSTGEQMILGVRHHDPESEYLAIAHDDSSKLAVIVDGEIFSFKGSFSMESGGIRDAELILKIYRDKGEGFLDYIDGSYSIAIWDGQERKLLLARDRVGFKPLFYFGYDGAFLFSSEIKGILSSGFYGKAVNLRSLNNFLSYGYVPNPDTLFDSISHVRPGHVVTIRDNGVEERPYWRFTYIQDSPDKDEVYYTGKFLDIFRDAVKRRVRRHPSCGAFLSGGLDTSGVVVMMREIRREPFKVFTGGFEEEGYNEFADAKVVADHLDLEHLTTIIDFKEDFPKLLEKLVWHHDAPFVDTSAIPSYFAAELARKHVDVVLTGDFPDQLIGGSGHQVKALARQQSDSCFRRLLRADIVQKLLRPFTFSAGTNSISDRIKRMVYRELFSLEEQRIILGMPVPELLKRCLYSPDMLSVNDRNDPLELARALYEGSSSKDLLDRLLYFDCLSYAPDDLMVKVERMTMAHGLVAFSPFHDRDLVEFIATVPSHLKIRGDIRKYVMKEALRPLLPEHTLVKKKKGFDMPIEKWLVEALSKYVREVLLDSRTLNRGYFDKKFMRKMVENFIKRETDYASGSEATIISLITLELWHRIFLDP